LKLRKTLARPFILGAVCALGGLGLTAGSANAATATWSCGADAVRATIAGQSPVNPVTASRTPCQDQVTGLPNLTNSLGLAPAINAKSAYAVLSAQPAGARPIEQTINSAAGVENLSLVAGGTVAIGADAVSSQATATCQNNQPVFSGSSKIVRLTLGGQVIPLDQPLEQITDALSQALGVIVSIKLDEQIKDANGIVVRGAHIKLLTPTPDSTPLADVVIAESRASASSACDPNADGNNNGSSTGTGGSGSNQLCPSGSVLDSTRGVCVIPASASGGQGTIVIGKPFTGPSGGSVISLTNARKKYKSPCLRGPGPKFVVVGTNKRDKITGRNDADRILALGGNDSVDGGRGDDCIDGGTGSDNISGGIGNDRLFGQSGNDHLNGGSGNDRDSAGSGNDTINTGYGRDEVHAGSGRDYINSSTAGPPATINCGAGPDKIRINANELKRQRGCEVVYVFNDKNPKKFTRVR
jgi:Ca2+-binding RTX toxin-like protein